MMSFKNPFSEHAVVWGLATLLVTMTIVGALAFLMGAEYGIGALLLSVLVVSAAFWIVGTIKTERAIDRIYSEVAVMRPKILTLVPAKIAKSAARRHRTHQAQVAAYLTEMASLVDRRAGQCSCCGRRHNLLAKYPFDPRFHQQSCDVSIAFQQYSSPELCPWGILAQQPQPILLLQLPEKRIIGLHHYAEIQADEHGFGSDRFYQAVGREYLLMEAVSRQPGAIEPVGRRVIAEMVSLGAFQQKSISANID